MESSKQKQSMSPCFTLLGNDPRKKPEFGWCCLHESWLCPGFAGARKEYNFKTRKLKTLRTHRSGAAHKRARKH